MDLQFFAEPGAGDGGGAGAGGIGDGQQAGTQPPAAPQLSLIHILPYIGRKW